MGRGLEDVHDDMPSTNGCREPACHEPLVIAGSAADGLEDLHDDMQA
jgi:hypothetical protein